MSKMILVALSTSLLFGCADRPVEKVPPQEFIEDVETYPLSLETEVDILFVIDNSNSMGQEQANLARNFSKFIDALRTSKLGSDGSGKPCTAQDSSGCKIPDVHIGVVSTDLGAGSYGLPSCEVSGGDGGKLLAKPRIAGCTPPAQPFIRYVQGVTNIQGGANDPIQQVKEAFQCIAEIGTGGCGFEHTLEAARRALDGCGADANNDKLGDCKLNPGFVRRDAMLAIVFITDEDDCSAQKPQLFDPQQTDLTDPLGPLTSYRCFEFGVQCDINDRSKPGPRKDCKPAFDWLYKVDDYVQFFKSLKRDEGRVIVSAIAGPTDKVEVGLDAQNPVLRPSCQTIDGHAVPALRIKGVVDGLDGQLFPICTNDFGPALKGIADKIVSNINLCLDRPPLSPRGGLVCSAGARIGTDLSGAPVTCNQSCLERADCVVKEAVPQAGGQEKLTVLPRCPTAKFQDPTDKDCGAGCPCWRLVPKRSCDQNGLDGYALDILRRGEAAKGSHAVVSCQTSALPWGSAEFSALPQCL